MSAAPIPSPPGCAHQRRHELWGGLLARCERCGLVSTARMPNFAYTEKYFVEDGAGYDFDSPLARTFDAERFERELAALEARGLGGKVLDVGCAIGSFLSHAKAHGWEIAGVEQAEFARREASRRLGVEIMGSLAALPAGRRYDVVTLHHVLEHIQEPAAFLAREVAPRVGRLMLVEVPNFASLAAQVEGPRWSDLRPEQHVHHFEAPTLRAVVEAAGFEVLRVYTLAEPLWSLRASLRTLRSLRALAGSRSFDPADLPPPASLEARDWRPPRGLRRAVVETNRWLLRPLVAWIEWTLRAGRLVLEARPGRGGS